MGLLLAGLASCSNNEVLDVVENQSLIQFKAPYVDKATRAAQSTVITAGDLTHIHVAGIYVSTATTAEGFAAAEKKDAFEGQTVGTFLNVQGSETAGFDTNKPWVANQLYSFAAYVDGKNAHNLGNDATAAFTLETLTSSKLNITGYHAGDNDLIVAMPEDVRITTISNYSVPLVFKHMLSKVRFTFVNQEHGTYEMDVTNIKVNNAYMNGNLEVTKAKNTEMNSKWSHADATKSGYTYSSVENIAAQGTGTSENFIIPQDTEGITVTFTITLSGGDLTTPVFVNYTASLNIGAVSNWTPGYAYNYTLNISAEDINPDLSETIKFSVSVAEWTNASGNITLTPSEVPAAGN